jgi:uncharacterized protein (DUF952 family)
MMSLSNLPSAALGYLSCPCKAKARDFTSTQLNQWLCFCLFINDLQSSDAQATSLGFRAKPVYRRTMPYIYKISPQPLWRLAEARGQFTGAPVDLADGFIHFSAAHQVRETATRHFKGQSDLLLATIEADLLGDSLKWEPSRGGDLFPHLYGALPMTAVVNVVDLPLDTDGVPMVPVVLP